MGATSLWAQDEDTLYLLGDKQMEADAIIGLDSMYNFNFEAAQKRFNWIKQEYPDHPLPYFLLGLNLWWKRSPNPKNEDYDASFLQYMDTVIRLSEPLKKGSLTEASFFLSGAYAMQAMLHGTRASYLKAAWAGRKALIYMKICERKSYLSAEIMMGRAMRNYYVEWIRENKPKLRFFLLVLERGNKKLGIEQMQEVANNAFYVRVEAQDYLMYMMSREEGYQERGLHLSAYLHQKYPKNTYFHTSYARFLYQMGEYKQCQKVCYNILDNVACNVPFYEHNSGRSSSYFLGWIFENVYGNLKTAKYHYEQCLYYASKLKVKKRGYNAQAALSLGNIAVIEKNYATAETYYKQTIDLSKKKHKTHMRAKEQLKALLKANRRS